MRQKEEEKYNQAMNFFERGEVFNSQCMRFSCYCCCCILRLLIFIFFFMNQTRKIWYILLYKYSLILYLFFFLNRKPKIYFLLLTNIKEKIIFGIMEKLKNIKKTRYFNFHICVKEVNLPLTVEIFFHDY